MNGNVKPWDIIRNDSGSSVHETIRECVSVWETESVRFVGGFKYESHTRIGENVFGSFRIEDIRRTHTHAHTIMIAHEYHRLYIKYKKA